METLLVKAVEAIANTTSAPSSSKSEFTQQQQQQIIDSTNKKEVQTFDRISKLESEIGSLVGWLRGRRRKGGRGGKVVEFEAEDEDEGSEDDFEESVARRGVRGGKLRRKVEIVSADSVSSNEEETDSSEQDHHPQHHQRPQPKQSTQKQASTSSTSSSSNPASYSTTGDISIDIIKAIEHEERKLREHEETYAFEIRSLAEKLKVAETVVQDRDKEVEVLKGQVSTQAKTISDMETKTKEETMKMMEVITSLKHEVEIKSNRIGEVEGLLMASEKNLNLEKEHQKELESKASKLEEDQKKITAQFVKYRDVTKTKLTELRQELDWYENHSSHIQKENETLSEKISLLEEMNKQRVESLEQSYNTEIAKKLAESTSSIVEKHKEEMNEMQMALSNTKAAYEALENEFLNRSRDDQERYNVLQREHNDLVAEFDKYREALAESSQNEIDMKNVIRDLSSIIKEQKLKISSLQSQIEGSYVVFGERVKSLKLELTSFEGMKNEVCYLQGEIEKWKGVEGLRRKEIDDLKREVSVGVGKVQELNMLLKTEKSTFENKIANLQADLSRSNEALEQKNEALRVKVIMLNDQNDTIKNLKQNLENKSREYTSIVDALTKHEEKHQAELQKERRKMDELKDELDEQEHVIQKLKDRLVGLTEERDLIKVEYLELSRKLKERNDSIIKIEEEVDKVKSIFQAKEDKLTIERDTAVLTKESALAELRRSYESEVLLRESIEKERNSLLNSLRQHQQEIGQVNEIRLTYEKEIMSLKAELEREKSKLNRLKDVIAG
ncbi:leucine rich repeat [Blyttiomyces sp. JEL0837]|nr:leucine rich repeat [Blyttiomyces sp. JEL0837]